MNETLFHIGLETANNMMPFKAPTPKPFYLRVYRQRNQLVDDGLRQRSGQIDAKARKAILGIGKLTFWQRIRKSVGL